RQEGRRARPSLLQVGYHPDLIRLRETMLEADGYEVTSAMGNDQGIAIATSRPFDVAVVGFSAPHSARHSMVRWLKLNAPSVCVVALLAHNAEHFPDADCETLSEDPYEWLGAIRRTCKGVAARSTLGAMLGAPVDVKPGQKGAVLKWEAAPAAKP
ncbi:MAG TPA: response regulator, partial [Gemmatimonadaceae bacterium]|nr:response regulator [Gemmatimonadaceae bacterium]